MDDINLHFTGDFHAITSAHSLLAATHRLCQWMISTCILPAISMPLLPPTACWQPCWIITSIREMP
ncbi:hypothetical protein DOZ58_04010 [Acetobacterium sp. KB-1]|nr:hypothetical protein DOZ58_04010 [Acetobacterium sp. KB-1]